MLTTSDRTRRYHAALEAAETPEDAHAIEAAWDAYWDQAIDEYLEQRGQETDDVTDDHHHGAADEG
jgi:hypothetical protein